VSKILYILVKIYLKVKYFFSIL